MKFAIKRELLLKPLQIIIGIVEKRQVQPVLANILIRVEENQLFLIGTDSETELLSKVSLEEKSENGTTTVSARKLTDISRSLPEESKIEFYLENNKLIICSGYSRFSLSTLPATDFPVTKEIDCQQELVVQQGQLLKLIDQVKFAMAQQDVRYYLNGMLWELTQDFFTAVATDGHRLALSKIGVSFAENRQVIVPRKAILELMRVLADCPEEDILISISQTQLRVKTLNYIFTSKLIDGKFPDYDKIIFHHPKSKVLVIDKLLLKQVLNRVSVLASDKHHGIKFELRKSLLRIIADNLEQEKAEDQITVDYDEENLNMAFNVNYFIDALTALSSEKVKLVMTNADSSFRIEGVDEEDTLYVMMPMRL